jgi:hypothetical protein
MPVVARLQRRQWRLGVSFSRSATGLDNVAKQSRSDGHRPRSGISRVLFETFLRRQNGAVLVTVKRAADAKHGRQT